MNFRVFTNTGYNKSLLYFIVAFFFIPLSYALDSEQDEITFFNVGQGHATLIHKSGKTPDGKPYTPLLIDAGSTLRPYQAKDNYTWEKEDSDSLVTKISSRILHIWQESNNNVLAGGNYKLNVIITHPDKDHTDFIPAILKQLEAKKQINLFTFTPLILCGGTKDSYEDKPKDENKKAVKDDKDTKPKWEDKAPKTKKSNKDALYKFLLQYQKTTSFSFEKIGLHNSDAPWEFLSDSGCITHLFCPKGKDGDPNTWSIITRIQMTSLSVMITGDAEKDTKSSMISAMQSKGLPLTDLKSDIYLLSHHGAEGTYHDSWDKAVDPKELVIGAGPNDKYHHPRGETLLKYFQGSFLSQETTMAHGVQFYSDTATSNQLQTLSNQHQRLFDVVPSSSEDSQKWHLVWTTWPIYTLWTTGSLSFHRSSTTPCFLDTLRGLMSYIAVPEPQYLFPPDIRLTLTPVTDEIKQKCDHIVGLLKDKFKGNDAEIIRLKNNFTNQLLLMSDISDRDHYLNTLSQLLSTDTRVSWWLDRESFHYLKEAIVGRNKKALNEQERLQAVLKFVFTPEQNIEISRYVSRRAFIAKAFLTSLHPIIQLKKYISLYDDILACYGPSNAAIEVICPFGYPEWIQLAKLCQFFCYETQSLTDLRVSLEDVVDLVGLRLEGKNFREIAQQIIIDYANLLMNWPEELQAVIKKDNELQAELSDTNSSPQKGEESAEPLVKELIKKHFYQKLEKYFPEGIEDFLS